MNFSFVVYHYDHFAMFTYLYHSKADDMARTTKILYLHTHHVQIPLSPHPQQPRSSINTSTTPNVLYQQPRSPKLTHIVSKALYLAPHPQKSTSSIPISTTSKVLHQHTHNDQYPISLHPQQPAASFSSTKALHPINQSPLSHQPKPSIPSTKALYPINQSPIYH